MSEFQFGSVPQSTTKSFTKSDNKIKFFSLRNDGEEAYVRFMHVTPAEFKCYNIHEIYYGGKKRKISCVHDEYSPITTDCPLCAGNVSTRKLVYFYMLQYTKDANGNVIATPVVWERPYMYGYRIQECYKDYGNLCDSVYKIVRHGASGSQDTRYEPIYQNQANFPESIYKKDFEAFDNYSPLGTIILNKTADEISTFLSTGEFPMRAKTTPANGNVAGVPSYQDSYGQAYDSTPSANDSNPFMNQKASMQTPTYSATTAQTAYNISAQQATAIPQQAPTMPPFTPPQQSENPWDAQPTAVQRPVRQY